MSADMTMFWTLKHLTPVAHLVDPAVTWPPASSLMLKDRISDSFLFLHSVDISYEVLNIHDEDVSCCIEVSVHNPSTEWAFEDFAASKCMVKSATLSTGFGGVVFRNFMNSAS